MGVTGRKIVDLPEERRGRGRPQLSAEERARRDKIQAKLPQRGRGRPSVEDQMKSKSLWIDLSMYGLNAYFIDLIEKQKEGPGAPGHTRYLIIQGPETAEVDPGAPLAELGFKKMKKKNNAWALKTSKVPKKQLRALFPKAGEKLVVGSKIYHKIAIIDQG